MRWRWWPWWAVAVGGSAPTAAIIAPRRAIAARCHNRWRTALTWARYDRPPPHRATSPLRQRSATTQRRECASHVGEHAAPVNTRTPRRCRNPGAAIGKSEHRVLLISETRERDFAAGKKMW